MPYLILKTVTVANINERSHTHKPGTVVSDWEVSDFVKEKIKEGSVWYRGHFEPLTQDEAQHHRVKATVAEGPRVVEGQIVAPPWDDYVGLHPEEVIQRMKSSTSQDEVTRVKLYERAGMNRDPIMDFTAPVEREPFTGYDDMGIRDVLSKMAILSDPDVADVIRYEKAHQNRPAITEYEKEEYNSPSAPSAPAAQAEPVASAV